MDYEAEDGVHGNVPEFGAIFMSNASTKRECLKRKLFGLPSAQANFVKQVKAGMVLFLFEFESRELYGVFRACCDGTMNIVPRAYSSSGKQFPAQVRFTPIWYCNPLSEYEFRDAIKENYFTKKKFNFGLSEDQVHRLLHLFSSRIGKFQRQIHRKASEPIGIDRSIVGNDKLFGRNRVEECDEEDNLVTAVNTRYPENSSSDFGRLDGNRFKKSNEIKTGFNMDNSYKYDILTEHPGAAFGKRIRDEDNCFSMQDRIAYDGDVDHGLEQVIGIDHPKSEKIAEDNKFLPSDRVESKCIMDRSIGPIVTSECFRVSLAKARRSVDDGRFSNGDIPGDKRSPDYGFRLITSTDHLENLAVKARRATDDCRFFMDCRVENECNLDSRPEPVISADHRISPLGRIRTVDGENFSNGTMEIEHCMVDKGLWYGYHLYKTSRVGDEGISKIDAVDKAYNMEKNCGHTMSTGCTSSYQSRQNPSSYARRPILEANYSVSGAQPKPHSAFPCSMEKEDFEFSYPKSHDALATRAIPYDPEVPDIHHRHSSSVGVDCTSHSVQNLPPLQRFGLNLSAASSERSSPFRFEAENLSQHLDVASGFVNKVPMPATTSYYNPSPLQTRSALLGAEYSGKMEAQTTGPEVYNGSLFSESTSASLPYSRSEIYERQNMSSLIEFDKHAVVSQGRYEPRIPQHGTNKGFCVNDVSFKSNMRYLHSGSSHEKSDDHDIKYFQNPEGMATNSKSTRTSVFARLTPASEEQVLEDNTELQYDGCNMGASVDQVMDTLHQSQNHRIMKARKLSSFRKHDMQCEKLKMMTLEMKNDVEQVIEENFDEGGEETRVVSFKRRSETRKNKNGMKMDSSVQKSESERLEGKQRKRRKLLRPVFGEKEPLNEGLSRDGSPNMQLSIFGSSHIENTGNYDDLVKSREDEIRSLLVQLTSPSGHRGNNAKIEQSSNSGEKYSENLRPVSGKKEFAEGINRDSTSNLQVSYDEGSNAKENTGSCICLIKSQENDNMPSQNVGFMHMTNATVCEAGNTNAESSDRGEISTVLCLGHHCDVMRERWEKSCS